MTPMLPTPLCSDWSLDHVGQAVESLDAAADRYVRTLGASVIERESVESQGVDVLFLNLHGSCIELLAPTRSDSTLRRFLDRRGEGLHHLCFRVTDIRKELARLAEDGIQLIDSEPRPGSRNMEIAFLHPRSFNGVLVELAQLKC